MRWRVAMVVAAALVATACGGGADGSDQTGDARPELNTHPTCQQVLDGDSGIAVAAWNIEPAAVGAWLLDDGSIAVTSADGLGVVPADASPAHTGRSFARWLCAEVSDPSVDLDAAMAEVFATPPGATVTCAYGTDATTKRVLAQAAETFSGRDVVANDIARWCTDTPDAAMFDGTWLAEHLSADDAADAQAEADASAAAVAQASADAKEAEEKAARHTLTWTTVTGLGYTYTSTLTIGDVSKNWSGVHPANSQLEPGAACGFNPDTDAYIPLTLTTTNATSGYAADPMKANFTVSRRGDLNPTTVTVALEASFSSGPSCVFDGWTIASSQSNFGVKWNDPVPSRQSAKSAQFLILRNYYSPRFPAGNEADLAAIVITGGIFQDESDPVTEVDTETLSLDGSYRK